MASPGWTIARRSGHGAVGAGDTNRAGMRKLVIAALRSAADGVPTT
jgi:hypothetical protein